MREKLKDAKTIVVKVGTSTLTHSTGNLNIRMIEQLVKVISDIKNSGKNVVLVSSGAIGVGANILGIPRPRDTRNKQAAAAVGQCELMNIYSRMFREYGHNVGQILITRDVIDEPKRRENVCSTFKTLLQDDVIPIVNENDSISTEEIEFGDNDTLSGVVAILNNADLLVILSDIDGLYDKNPQQYPDAKLISEVKKITQDIEKLCGDTINKLGTGGMKTKIEAAKSVLEKNISMVIANGKKPGILYDILDGKDVGTFFSNEK